MVVYAEVWVQLQEVVVLMYRDLGSVCISHGNRGRRTCLFQ